MANYLNRPSIFEIATAYEDGKNREIKPKTNVVVNTIRKWYGKKSTVTFIATAYNEQGEKIDSMKGYFLEPHVNYDSAKIANSDKAIMYGTYNIISKAELEKKSINNEEIGVKRMYILDLTGM